MAKASILPVLELEMTDYGYIIDRVTPTFRQLAGSSVLITGAAGFIGSYLMDFFRAVNQRLFIGNPCRVLGLDNMVAASRAPVSGDGVEFQLIKARDSLSQWRPRDWYIHAASIAAPAIYLHKPLETIEANVDMTVDVLNAARYHSVNGVLHMSSSEVYGNPTVLPTPEDYWGNVSFMGPRAVYGESKRFAETLCQTYYREFKVPVKIARPFNIYGPGENINDGRLVPQLMKALIHDRPFTIYGDGKASRTLCYVADAVVQLLAVLLDGQEGEAYNVGSDEELTLTQIAGLGDLIKSGLAVEYVKHHEVMAGAPTRWCPELTKIKRLSNLMPMVTLDGLRLTYEYYSDVKALCED
jgi:dTDP-glucose 4,6-dehydratase/UDP-glucuronate decarboxylase